MYSSNALHGGSTKSLAVLVSARARTVLASFFAQQFRPCQELYPYSFIIQQQKAPALQQVNLFAILGDEL